MAKLTSKARNALPASDFGGPDRSYPMPDKSHAANAKARVANKSPALKAKVDAKANKILKASKGMSNVMGPGLNPSPGSVPPAKGNVNHKGGLSAPVLSSMVNSLRSK